MHISDRFKAYLNALKLTSLITGGTCFIAYQFYKTYKSIGSIVNTNVLDREKKYTPEYIYIEDPAYNLHVTKLQEKENNISIGFLDWNRIWKSMKHSLAWRLLWLCKHGNREQRNIALKQLANFKTNKAWDCMKLAQAMDKNTAVLLARTYGADLRYFLPPPIHIRRAAKDSHLLSFKLRDMILAVQNAHPHSCIEHFLSKRFINIQDQPMDSVDLAPSKPDSINERELCILCLDALHHHINLFHQKNYKDDVSAMTLIKMNLLGIIAELFLRYPEDPDIDMAIIRILTVLSIYKELLENFFQSGIIGQLSRLVKSKDVRLSSSAAVTLTNLSGEQCYRPGLYLLYPIYRTTKPHICDVLLVHGLRGGVFVTWRQRDKKCAEPVGINEVTISNLDCETCEPNQTQTYNIPDPELRQVIEDIIEFEDESLLSDLDVVLHDIPISAKRDDVKNKYRYIAKRKRQALIEEENDRCNYTLCWPKDWLPQDIDNLRILGVNYWSSLSEWLERCPSQTAEINTRADELAPTLVDADVGKREIPVVWLAHSMGGLIVKQLLIDAASNHNNDHKKLSESTKAVLFYSTPHRGSSLAKMPRAASAVLWPSNDVTQLQQNSPVLLKMDKEFVKTADIYNWETICFAETKPTLITAFKVPVNFVEPNSADLGRGIFYELPLDHLSICKPATRQSIIYTTVLDVLQRVTDKQHDLSYSNIVSDFMYRQVWWPIGRRATEMLESIDESKNDEDLKWFEQILLNAFTDGFSD